MEKVYIIMIDTQTDDGPNVTTVCDKFFLTEESACKYIKRKWPTYNTYIEYISKMYAILEERFGECWGWNEQMEVRSSLIERYPDFEELEGLWEDTSIFAKKLTVSKDRR